MTALRAARGGLERWPDSLSLFPPCTQIKVLGGEIETLLASNQNGAPGGDPPSDPPPLPQGGERGRSRTQKRRGRRSSDQSRSSRSYSSNDSRSSRGSYSSGGSRSRSSGSRSYSSRSSRSSYSGDSRSRSRSRSGSRSGSSRSRSGSRSRSRSGSRSRSRSPTGSKESKNNRGSSSTPAKRNKRATVVKYRSPLYRTIAVVAALTKGKVDTRSGRDQTRKGRRGRPKERVVVSNFSRAPRFRENKAWVPGAAQRATSNESNVPTELAHTTPHHRSLCLVQGLACTRHMTLALRHAWCRRSPSLTAPMA